MECSEADGFHILLVTYEHEEDESLAPNDLLLLSIEEVHLLLCSSSLFLYKSHCKCCDVNFFFRLKGVRFLHLMDLL